jgi:hypothetical protein
MDRGRRDSFGMLALLAPAAFMALQAEEAEAANLPFPTYAYAASGGTALRTTPARFADIINVKEFGAAGDGVSDDTTEFAAWINFLQANTAQPLAGFIPAGKYRISAPLPRITHPIGIYGAGTYKTWLVLDTAMSGDLFSFSECWRGVGGAWPNLGPTVLTNVSTTGVVLRDFTVLGNRTSAATQNCFVFYDRNDDVHMENVEAYYVNGRAIYVGVLSGQTQGYMRESRFTNCKFFWCGASNTVPVVEFDSKATSTGSDGTNEIVVDNMQIYSPYGPGFLVHNTGPTSGSTRAFQVAKLRVEGNSAVPPVATSDLVKVGDTTSLLSVKGIYFSDTELLISYPGGASFRVTAAAGGAVPSQIGLQASIGVGGQPSGVGVSIDAGRLIMLDMRQLSVSAGVNHLVVGPSSLVTGQVFVNGYGQESTWQTAINATAAGQVVMPRLGSGIGNLINAASDAAAATAGVPIGKFYRNGNAVQIRLA